MLSRGFPSGAVPRDPRRGRLIRRYTLRRACTHPVPISTLSTIYLSLSPSLPPSLPLSLSLKSLSSVLPWSCGSPILAERRGFRPGLLCCARRCSCCSGSSSGGLRTYRLAVAVVVGLRRCRARVATRCSAGVMPAATTLGIAWPRDFSARGAAWGAAAAAVFGTDPPADGYLRGRRPRQAMRLQNLLSPPHLPPPPPPPYSARNSTRFPRTSGQVACRFDPNEHATCAALSRVCGATVELCSWAIPCTADCFGPSNR